MLIVERVAALNRTKIFADLPDYALAEVAQIVEEQTFAAGERIIEEGALEAWMFILVEGRARVAIKGVNFSAIGPGNSVGELAILDPAPRAATVTAIDPCLLFRLDQIPFQEVMQEQPQVMTALLTMLVRLVRSETPIPPSTA